MRIRSPDLLPSPRRRDFLTGRATPQVARKRSASSCLGRPRLGRRADAILTRSSVSTRAMSVASMVETSRALGCVPGTMDILKAPPDGIHAGYGKHVSLADHRRP